MKKLNVVLNDNIILANEGETILELCQRNGINIPTLCHDNRLAPYASCFVCVVEIVGMRGLQPSCATKVTEGMKIFTDNEKIFASRKAALELIASNHYADCVAPCKLTCPAGVDVQGYIALISKGLYVEAVELIKKTNPLPAICGRVCVRPCEVACRRHLVDDIGVGIDYLKRFASDKDLSSNEKFIPVLKPNTNKKIAVIGAGPAGLSAAYFLALEGHNVEIFEASPFPGGMLRYGIPPYRLPNEIIDAEVKNITDMGVIIHYNKRFGTEISYKNIKEAFNASIITIGSQIGTRIGCENDDADNIFSGIDFLRNMEMTAQKYDFTGKKVAVIGGGNTAMDCCRTAMRCGAEKVYVIYRRTEMEMPANPIEIHESKIEGVAYMFLTAPAKVIKSKEGVLQKLICYKMELGEPDASGRRRPVKVDNSEFEVKLDYILAAIGQKTNVDFVNDINEYANSQLLINKWGDIDAAKNTLQTSVPEIFAAGDAVTGPATLIEAIAQGRKAANSAHRFVMNLPLENFHFEFLSLKENFEIQKSVDYKDIYVHSKRNEMPVLNADERFNFNEVEQGYSQEMALNETKRCLECGCTAYFDCELKMHASSYNVEQKNFMGRYDKHPVDFSHPFIEFDNNKCILCARCVRICKDVVGAHALGLVERGFETYVAPSLGKKLADTDCEACGLCISTCPTAAISENVVFKPGPLETKSFKTICNYCSIGCEIELHHINGFFMKVVGGKGLVNSDKNICKYPKFGYNYLNDNNRLFYPLYKINGKFEPISFEKAYEIINDRIQNSLPESNAVFAGARLTNEEIFLINKWGRAVVKTNNISSFHYWKRKDGFINNLNVASRLDELQNAKKIFLIGSEINSENAVAGFMINNAIKFNDASLYVIDENPNNRMFKKAHYKITPESNYYFIKALIYYYIYNNLYNSVFINKNCDDFDAYKNLILSEDFNNLLSKAGVTYDDLVHFANVYNNEQNAILLYAEKNVDKSLALEIFNLSLITGKRGKMSSGIIALKEKNNAQGLFDMGLFTFYDSTGFSKEEIHPLEELWQTTDLPLNNSNVELQMEEGKIKNLFVFGEDPLGCAANVDEFAEIFNNVEFKVVQDYFLTETAKTADLVLPSSLPFEIGGTFTNTDKFIQKFEPHSITKKEFHNSYKQLANLINFSKIKHQSDNPNEIFNEYTTSFKNFKKKKLRFVYTHNPASKSFFNHGCDYINKTFDDYFKSKIT